MPKMPFQSMNLWVISGIRDKNTYLTDEGLITPPRVASSEFYILWNIFSGFLIPRPRIPVWWRWFYWTCPFAWTLYGLLASQYGDVEDMLDNSMTVEQFLRNYYGFRHSFIPVVGVVIVTFTVSLALLCVQAPENQLAEGMRKLHVILF